MEKKAEQIRKYAIWSFLFFFWFNNDQSTVRVIAKRIFESIVAPNYNILFANDDSWL